ncbi:hypothetical protein [Acidiphilium multivorum]|uniref:hypothetical protein n=1 Tax=Acidiphilium multivorum TaxID=62140 RepID=UPI003B97DF84
MVSGGGRMEIITGVERRRRWRDEDKLRIVAEAEAPGAVLLLQAMLGSNSTPVARTAECLSISMDFAL